MAFTPGTCSLVRTKHKCVQGAVARRHTSPLQSRNETNSHTVRRGRTLQFVYPCGAPILIHTLFASVVLLLTVLFLSGCGNAGANRTDGAVAVVNGERITLQVEDTASIAGGPVGLGRTAEAARAVEQEIDRAVLVQRALEMRLDRNPQVVREIENARRRILAQAYLSQVVSAAQGVLPEEVREFYKSRPALFSARRVFVLQELTARVSKQESAGLEARLGSSGTLKEVARWLRSRSIPFHVTVSTKAAEQIPAGMLSRVSAMKTGEIVAFLSGDSIFVIELLQSHPAPLTEEQAAPLIKRYLTASKQLERAAAEVGKLRQQASIKYPGREARTSAALRAAASTANRATEAPQNITPEVSGL